VLRNNASKRKIMYESIQAGASKVHRRNLSTIGSGIVHGKAPGYLNVYHNPALGLNGPRSAGKKRASRNKKADMTATLPVLHHIDNASNESREPTILKDGDHSMEQDAKAEAFDLSQSPRSGAHGSTRNNTQFKTFDPSRSTMQDVTSVVDARKMRMFKENEVRKLHNRIALL
jgi:hypothetical protein